MLFLLIVIWQIVLLGMTFVFAGHAARAGARALAVGDAIKPAAIKELPSAWQGGTKVSQSDNTHVQVEVKMPVLLPGTLHLPLTIGSKAGTVIEDQVLPWERQSWLMSNALSGSPAMIGLRLLATLQYVPGNTAVLLPNGTAAAPVDAPLAVKEMIAAANEINSTPYLWGGGYGGSLAQISSAYDCSSATSFVLFAAGLHGAQADDSSGLEGWGLQGLGNWVTVYANAGRACRDRRSELRHVGRRGDAAESARQRTALDDEAHRPGYVRDPPSPGAVMRRRLLRLDLVLGVTVVVVVAIAILSSRTAGSSPSSPPSPRPVADSFGRSYAGYLDGRVPVSALPAASRRVRSIATDGPTIPPASMAGSLRVTGIRLRYVNGAPAAQAVITVRDRRRFYPFDVGLSYAASRWSVVYLVAPDVGSILAAAHHPPPPSLRRAATTFALAYAGYRAGVKRRSPSAMPLVGAQIAAGQDPLADLGPGGAGPTLKSLAFGPPQGSLVAATAIVRAGAREPSFTFLLRRAGERWEASSFLETSS